MGARLCRVCGLPVATPLRWMGSPVMIQDRGSGRFPRPLDAIACLSGHEEGWRLPFRWLRIRWPRTWVPANRFAPPLTPPEPGMKWERATGSLPGFTGGIAWQQVPVDSQEFEAGGERWSCALRGGCMSYDVCVPKHRCVGAWLQERIDIEIMGDLPEAIEHRPMWPPGWGRA